MLPFYGILSSMIEHKKKKQTVRKIAKEESLLQKSVGHPPIFRTPEELTQAIDNYFNTCPDKRTIFFKLKDSVEKIIVPHITICKLCYYLGFESRQSFYDYEKRGKEFSYIIKRARLFIEGEYEKMMLDNPPGAIFALKNMGWRDTQHLEQNINEYLHEDMSGRSIAELKEELNKLEGI